MSPAAWCCLVLYVWAGATTVGMMRVAEEVVMELNSYSKKTKRAIVATPMHNHPMTMTLAMALLWPLVLFLVGLAYTKRK